MGGISSLRPNPEETQQQCIQLRDRLSKEGIYQPGGDHQWRISPEPFWLFHEEITYIRELGNHLLAFYQAQNHLYQDSLKGRQPEWISQYLNQGKPEDVLMYGRMNRFKSDLPGIIRPDLIPTDQGFIATELDSVPGGIGLTGSLAVHYTALGYSVIGEGNGMIDGFARLMLGLCDSQTPSLLAIIVSNESLSYRPEMMWLAAQLESRGLPAKVVNPSEIIFKEEGLFLQVNDRLVRIEAIYRFFELFDLKNIPKIELILYSIKKGQVRVTPPLKSYHEEKMSFSFLHHPVLESFWESELGSDRLHLLKQLFPQTWVMDPQPVPPHAVIHQFQLKDRPLTDWRHLANTTQNERRFVIKPSGFSELAWGSHGVSVGHDLSQSEWKGVVETALSSFNKLPYVIQPFHKGKKYTTPYYDESSDAIKMMSGRARLSPYYFVHEGQAELGGILATLCPLDKKLLHGMVDAVMVPCAVR